MTRGDKIHSVKYYKANKFMPNKKSDMPKSAVDVVIFGLLNQELSMVLIQMKKKPFESKWAFPGGLVKLDESLDEAARRELKEKTGLANVYLEQLYTFGEIRRDPFSRVVSTVYYALINSHNIQLKTTDKYKDIKWVSFRKLPPLAYDHNGVAKLAVERLRAKLSYTNIVYSLLPKRFALSELQGVYENILGKKLDKRNFRKKIGSLKLLKNTRKYRRGNAFRPALLYEFRERCPKIIEII
jgi:8-oxo-dGTP diphosphatase